MTGGFFYVYEHWRPDKDTCFWVGKGRGRRAYYFKRNSRYNRVIAKLANMGMCAEVRLVAESLSEQEAFRIEQERILFWREQGPDLCNMTDGGEGASGLRHSSETKALIASQKTGLKASDETRRKMSASQIGRTHSAESRAKLSATKTGKPQGPHTPEHNAKISAAGKGRRDPIDVRMKKRDAALRRNPVSDEVKEQIALSVKGLWCDPAYRARLEASHLKRAPVSESARENMRKAQRTRRAAELVGD